MQIKLNDNDTVFIRFSYDLTNGIRSTACTVALHNSDLGKVAEVEGVAVCARRDNFHKATGRKVALTKALGRSALRKAERAAIWKGYFEVVNDLK
jgi:hypothetical protein